MRYTWNWTFKESKRSIYFGFKEATDFTWLISAVPLIISGGLYLNIMEDEIYKSDSPDGFMKTSLFFFELNLIFGGEIGKLYIDVNLWVVDYS